MPNVKLPKFLNPESLYLYCELTAYDDNGGQIDFTGLKTYSIGFMKENLGFGITDINIEINPSQQPIIEISFKDFYGNLAFGFSENKKIIETAAGTSNVGDLDFSSMFNLPYPKFKLTIKGYLGNPVVLELNVKKINVALVPSDGSYEIKALFVPNIYGFFADMPYYFLKAVKALRLNGADPNGTGPGSRSFIEKNYISTWDIAVLGEEIQQEIQTIEESFGDIKINIKAFLEGKDRMFDLDWFKTPTIEGRSKTGLIKDGDKSFQDIYFNIEPLVTGKANLNLTDVRTGSALRRGFKKNVGAWNGISNREYMRRALIASITTKPGGKKYDLLTLPNNSDVERGTAILNDNLKILKAFRNQQLTKGKETKIKQVTIKNIFDLLIKDSAFLLGKILGAGQEGFTNHADRKNSKEKFGNYFPFIQDPSSQEQIPDPTASEELKFVNEFVRALTEGIISDTTRNSNTTPSDLNNSNTIEKRISNLEIISSNPFDTTNVDSFIESLLLRSGIAVSMLDEATGVSYEFKIKFWNSLGNKFDELIKSEIENASEGIKKISASSSKYPLINFCTFIENIINPEGRLLDSNKSIVDLTQPVFQNILQLKYKLPDDTTEKKLGDILDRYLPARTGINPDSYKAYSLSHNGLTYFNRFHDESKIIYVLFKNNPNNLSSNNFTQANSEKTQAYASDRFIIDELKSIEQEIDMGAETNKTIVDLINEKRILDYDKLKSNNNINSQTISIGSSDVFFTGVTSNDTDFSKLNTELKNNNYYVGLLSTGGNDVVWNLFGNDSIWNFQRKYLREMCTSIKSKIIDNNQESAKKVTETIDKLESQYNVFYTQFHHICNNWKNLLLGGLSTSKNIAEALEEFYTSEKNNRVIYEIPLQTIQETKGTLINLENAIVNPQPLLDNNSETTVLNIMGSLCHLNNFMFLSVPGNALREQNIQEVFTPFDRPVKTDSITVNNFFYVLFMPTPENRIAYNNQDPLYQTFVPQLKKDVFEIDFGSIDNTIIKSINLTTEDNKVTAESAIAISDLVDGPNSKKAKNIDCSALSIMQGRSYKINGEMIGNAQIVPTQFFIINKIPIFNGLYQIMKVKHHYTNNNMTTSFEAIKMKFAGNSKSFIFIPPITLTELGINNDLPKTLTESPRNVHENFDLKDLKDTIKPTQEGFLKNLHPDVQDKFREFVNAIQDKTGFAVLIQSGYRTIAEQTEEKRKNENAATPGLSYHNYGMALDINLQNGDKIIRQNSTTQEWEDSGVLVIARQLNLRWGGEFRGYDDRVHFDAGFIYPSTNDLLNQSKLQFGTNINNIQGNKLQLA